VQVRGEVARVSVPVPVPVPLALVPVSWRQVQVQAQVWAGSFPAVAWQVRSALVPSSR